MIDKTSHTKRRRMSQGWRKHVRRLKQEARKAGLPYRQPSYHSAPNLVRPEADKSPSTE